MKTLIDQLSQYADYHRDPRNILTHFFGVPLIMWAVVILLARLQWAMPLGDGLPALPLSLALLAALAAGIYYCL
ncbi:Mpo1-like protein, partial [Delftia acidovorans]